jgi:proteasome lid subunit RPN8/RPN11
MTDRRVKFDSHVDPEAQDELLWGRGAANSEIGALGGFTLYRCHNEQNRPGDYNILFSKKAYGDVVRHLKEDTKREHGGLLLGYATGTSGPGTPTVVVILALRAKQASGTPTSLTFAVETWRDWDNVDVQLKNLGLPLQRVGWYHSHPNLNIFLSRYDLDVCTLFDRLKCPVALVVDPVKDLGGFFIRSADGYHPNSPKGFWEIHGEEESGVAWRNVNPVPFGNGSPEEGRGTAVAVPAREIEAESSPEVVSQPASPPKSVSSNGQSIGSPLWLKWALIGATAAVAVFAVLLGLMFNNTIRQQHELAQLSEAVKQIKAIPSSTTQPAQSEAINGTGAKTQAGDTQPTHPATPSQPPQESTIKPKPLPTLSALDPAAVPVNGGTQEITIRGTGLGGTTKVRVGGKERKLKSVSDKVVTFTLAKADATKAGDLQVQVVPASGVAQVLTLKVSNPTPATPPASPTTNPPNPPAKLSVTTKSLPEGATGMSYGPVRLTVSGGAAPYKWKADGLPEGLTLDPTGELKGTPAAGSAGSHDINLTVSDKDGSEATAKLPLTVM